MNMKKLMAVVLAVVIAISAMAINVFAAEGEEIKIDLLTNREFSSSRKNTFTFEVPMYAMFGYADQNHYLEVVTPMNLSDKGFAEKIDWAIEVNGTRYALKSTTQVGENEVVRFNDKYDVFTQYVNFGFFAHPYYNNELWTTIPQSTGVNQITTIKLIADVTLKSNYGWDPTVGTGDFVWGDLQEAVKIQLCQADANGVKTYDETQRVAGSTIYARTMQVSKTDGTTDFSYNKFEVISTPQMGETAATEYVLTWDHTLQNKAYVLNAASAKLVVELGGDNPWEGAGTTTGSALYSLWMGDAKVPTEIFGSDNNLWWQNDKYNRERGFVSTCTVNGTVSALEFDVPVDMLYNSTYGYGSAAVYNGGFKIFRQFEADKSAFNNGKLNGQDVGYRHLATKAYLVLTMPADEEPDINVDEPVEPGDVTTEPDEPTIDVNEPVDEPKEENPPMGIALAVLPMVLAAAAVATSKKR